MNRTRLWIAIGLLALLLIGAWSWHRHAEPVPPSVTPEPQTAAVTPAPATELSATQAPTEPRSEQRTPVASTTESGADRKPEFALIRVLVLDKENDKPLSGATVTVSHETKERSRRVAKAEGSRGKPFESITTGADGRAEIEMPPSVTASVSVSGRDIDAGFAKVDVLGLAPGDEHEVVVQLPTANDMPFWMKLVAEETQAPLPWVGVEVQRTGKSSDELHSDANGLIHFSGRTWERSARLFVHADGRAEIFVLAEPGHVTKEEALVVPLALASTLRVELDDGSTPVPGAKITLTTEGYQRSFGNQSSMEVINLPDARWSATTDAAGRATIERVSPRVPLRVSIGGSRAFEPAEKIVLEPGETRSVKWDVGNACTLHGVVLDQKDRPLADETVWLRPADVPRDMIFNEYFGGTTRAETTAADGSFNFKDVSPGDWHVGPRAAKVARAPDANGLAPLARFVRVDAGAKNVEVVVRVDRGLFIRGKVIAADGGVARGFVRGIHAERKLFVGGQCDPATGTFEMGPLMAGRYRLTASGGKDAESETIEVDAGTDGVELRLRASAKIGGRVVDENGGNIDARIAISQRPPSTTGVHYPGTRNGEFELSSLAPGVYDVAASTTDGRVGILENVTLTAAEPRTDLVIRVDVGGTIRVKHRGPDKFVGISVRYGDVHVSSDGVERDTTRAFAAPAGSVVVRATYQRSPEPRVVEKTVQVTAGSTIDVVFETQTQ